ncbi:uncharacterized protein LOC143617547 [Bidens hawaiensis]|uniref:uncharacterized protein LOC143617547 n=1 Tax=Bidens hawaiensis TaxID=980011 RepID=UPI004048FD08
MMNPTKLARNLLPLFKNRHRDLTCRLHPSSPLFAFHHFQSHPLFPNNNNNNNSSLKTAPSFDFSFAHYSTATTTNAVAEDSRRQNPKQLTHCETNDEVEPIPDDLWEEEDDESDPQIGDGGNGGGVVLQNCPWGERALSIAQQVLQQFGDDIKIFSFKTSPRGYIYVRLDRLCNEYGCPSMEDIQSYNHEYKKKLDEAGDAGDIPNDLALEVSSPGADRLLRIPNDLQRFENMAMRVKYIEHDDSKSSAKEGVFFLESIEMESGSCVWKLADVKENRYPASKGRPMSRKQKDWRLKLPYEKLEQVTLYLDYH